MFYNELNLLLYRLNLLHDVVHKFVLVEASISFMGNDKCCFFDKCKEEFKPFLDKIIHIKLEKESFPYPNPNTNTNQQWENEYFQRNALCNGFYVSYFQMLMKFMTLAH